MIPPSCQPRIAEAAPAKDDRAAPRAMMLYRETVIEAGRRVGLCVVKNISTGGAMIRTRMALGVDEPVTLVMASGRRATGRVRWRNSDLGGVAFDTSISLSWLLDRTAGLAHEGACRRLPRVFISVPATVSGPEGTIGAQTCDISTHGARLAVDRDLVIGPVTVQLAGLAQVRGRVLWSTNGQSGCIFDTPFSIDEITGWLRSREAGPGTAPFGG